MLVNELFPRKHVISHQHRENAGVASEKQGKRHKKGFQRRGMTRVRGGRGGEQESALHAEEFQKRGMGGGWVGRRVERGGEVAVENQNARLHSMKLL